MSQSHSTPVNPQRNVAYGLKIATLSLCIKIDYIGVVMQSKVMCCRNPHEQNMGRNQRKHNPEHQSIFGTFDL